MNEATNWFWLKQPLRHLSHLVLLGWLAGLFYWLTRCFFQKATDQETAGHAKRMPSVLPESFWEDVVWRPVRPALCRFDEFGRKKRDAFLCSGIRCIDFQGYSAPTASVGQACRQADPPWLPTSS